MTLHQDFTYEGNESDPPIESSAVFLKHNLLSNSPDIKIYLICLLGSQN